MAFALATTARRHLRRSEADRIYVAIGAGDAFEAIGSLLNTVAQQNIPVTSTIVADLCTWLDRYRGQDVEPRLRELLDQVIVVDDLASRR